MLRLNMRHTNTEIGIRQQYVRMDAHMKPAELSTEYVAPRSNIGLEQPKIEIDSYPSRHSYGFTNHTDFASEHGQAGMSDVQSSTADHMREAWRYVDQGARPGYRVIQEGYKNDLNKEIMKERVLVAQKIPNPKIRVTPVRTHGGTDPGKYKMHIKTYDHAEIKYHPASVETYIKQKGELHQWVTEGRYDIYA